MRGGERQSGQSRKGVEISGQSAPEQGEQPHVPTSAGGDPLARVHVVKVDHGLCRGVAHHQMSHHGHGGDNGDRQRIPGDTQDLLVRDVTEGVKAYTGEHGTVRVPVEHRVQVIAHLRLQLFESRYLPITPVQDTGHLQQQGTGQRLARKEARGAD